MLTAEDGKFLVELARKAIVTYLGDREVIKIPEDADPRLKENMGVFVTLNRGKELRGCIGYPEPIMPLLNAVVDAAISAATKDPRFNPLTPVELDEIHVEVSVLTKPTLIEVENPWEYLKNIKVGQDGLIVEMGPYRGLLLPQVATEWGWNEEEFLSNTCMKAGLSSDCWLNSDVRIYRFASQIFEE
jgi:uncharacterized protein (TIGR00296 family)